MATNITVLSNRVQPDVIGCPKTVVENAVIDAIIKFCEETYIIEQAFEHDVVEADIIAGDNDSVNVDIVADGGVSATLRPIVVTEFRIDGAQWETEYIELLNDLDDLSEISSADTKLFTYPDRTHIKFFGIDAEDQRFYIKQAYAPLTSITSIDDYIYDRYHKAIEAKAKWELMSTPGKDWSNAINAEYNDRLYNDGVASAKILKSHGFAHGNKRVKSRQFFLNRRIFR
jgi:hypothetical protein